MKKPEIKLITYLFFTLLLAAGLLTGFDIAGLKDIQLHDTYYVIYHSQLILLLAIIITSFYLLTYGAKRMASINPTLKYIALLLGGILTTTSLALIALSTYASFQTTAFSLNNEFLGLLVFLIGMMILFISRTIEVKKIKFH